MTAVPPPPGPPAPPPRAARATTGTTTGTTPDPTATTTGTIGPALGIALASGAPGTSTPNTLLLLAGITTLGLGPALLLPSVRGEAAAGVGA